MTLFIDMYLLNSDIFSNWRTDFTTPTHTSPRICDQLDSSICQVMKREKGKNKNDLTMVSFDFIFTLYLKVL